MTPLQIANIHAKMLSLSQTYSAIAVNSKNEISLKVYQRSAACFGTTYGIINRMGRSTSLAKKIRLRVTMYTDPEANIQNNINNVVFLKREQIIQWMDELCVMFQAYGLTYKIIDTQIQRYPGSSRTPANYFSAIHIVVKAQSISYFWIKWILSYIRLMSETTCSWVLPEAFTLRELIPELKTYPILSTFMFIWSSCQAVHAFTTDLSREGLGGGCKIFTPRTMDYLIDTISKKYPANGGVDRWHEGNFRPTRFSLTGPSFQEMIRQCWKCRFNDDKYIRECVLVGQIPDNILELYKTYFEKIKANII